MRSLRIVAIDGGPIKSAYAIIDAENAQIHEVDILENYELLERLKTLRIESSGSSEAFRYELVVEQIKSYGNAVGDSLLHTQLWGGRFIQAFVGNSKRFDLLPRKTVVTELCGNPRAKDSNVRQALTDLYADILGESALKIVRKGGSLAHVKKDMWSSLAIANVYKTLQDRKLKDLLS